MSRATRKTTPAPAAALTLPLAEAGAVDAGRAILRLGRAEMAALGLSPGDTIRLTGARATHARVLPAAPGAPVCAAGADVAANAGAEWGATVTVAPALLAPLRSLRLTPAAGALPETAQLAEALFDMPLTAGDVLRLPGAGDVLRLPGAGATPLHLTVAATDPAPAGLFTAATALALQPPATPRAYAGIGGLDAQIARVHEMIATPLRRPDLFTRLGLPPPRGVLFTGPPGAGKTLLARQIAAETAATFFQIAGPEIMSKHYGESEAALRRVFAAAAKEAPAIVFIDEIDAIAPRRAGLSDDKQVERRVVAQLLTLMDGLDARGQVVVMAATNLPDDLDPALRRPGRFDREIAFTAPDATGRAEILRIHLAQAPLAPGVDLAAVAARAHGYVGADLAALAREAALAALARATAEAGGEAALAAEALFITATDLETGLARTAPSALRDAPLDSAPVAWDDVGGMDAEKAALHQAVVLPLRHRDTFGALRLAPVRGVLLAGPPGSGKTLLARALAQDCGMNVMPLRASRVLAQYLGDAERQIASHFARARAAAPTLVFIDEIDALAPRRTGKDAALDRIVTQLLTEMDGLSPKGDVVVLATTNRAAALDPALLRPGRFDLVVPVGLPDAEARAAILAVALRGLPLAQGVTPARIAAATPGTSGATLAALVQQAAREAAQRCLAAGPDARPEIVWADIAAALARQATGDSARAIDFIAPGAAPTAEPAP